MTKKNTPAFLKRRIFKDIDELFGSTPAAFVPGETHVHCSGRVFDADEVKNAVDACLDFWLTSGRFAREFEGAFSSYLGVRHSLLVNSGSSANLLAVTALTSRLLKRRRIKPGDEIITTAAAFPTTVNPIVQNGCTPVFVDIDIPSYNADPGRVAKAIGKKTRAIFMAHTLGNPFDVVSMRKIADKHGLFLIEDSCDALGSACAGRYAGTFGDIGTFSFYPAHHITMGEGGALVTDNALLDKIIRSLRDWGRECWCDPGKDNSCGRRFAKKFGRLPKGYDHKYVYSHIGYNLKITDMQAAIGVAQLKKLPRFIEIRKSNFARLSHGLRQYAKWLVLPEPRAGTDPSWFGFLISVRKDAGFSKNQLVEFLEKRRIATRMLFAGNITKQPSFAGVPYRVSGVLKNTDFVMNSTFWIGVYPGITPAQVEYILETFHDFFAAL